MLRTSTDTDDASDVQASLITEPWCADRDESSSGLYETISFLSQPTVCVSTFKSRTQAPSLLVLFASVELLSATWSRMTHHYTHILFGQRAEGDRGPGAVPVPAFPLRLHISLQQTSYCLAHPQTGTGDRERLQCCFYPEREGEREGKGK